MSIQNGHHLLWLDLETTGDQPTQDLILEAAAIITDPQLNELPNPTHERQRRTSTLGSPGC